LQSIRANRVDRAARGKADAMPGRRIFQRWATAAGLLFCLLTSMLAVSAVGSDSVVMHQVSDLRQEAEISRTRKLVLVLEVSSENCIYCRKLEALFLLPMQRNAYYDDRILVRSISLDEYNSVIDFDGRSIAGSEFAAGYGVSLTPTLLFLDADGNEISERLVGIWSEDFFGGFIDERIDEARQKL
jgi:thioredoxin-related protein